MNTINLRSINVKRLGWVLVCITLMAFISACGGGSSSSATSATYAPVGGTSAKALALAGTVSTFAGIAPGSVDATGSAAQFNGPNANATDGTNLYVADSANHTIRKVVIATGAVTTLAGTAGVFGNTDGAGAAASFFSPQGIATDGTNLYVADTGNHVIRKVVIATGAVTTIAGRASSPGSADGTGLAAQFGRPNGIATDNINIYVSDSNNNNLRAIVIATGAVSTLAGDASLAGSADGVGLAAQFRSPYGLATDGKNLYVADSGNNTIRKVVIASGAVTTLAGKAAIIGKSDGTGSAATFYYPAGIILDGTGTNLYVADAGNGTIRKMAIATGAVSTFAGTAGLAGSTNATGAAAMFNSPQGVATDGTNLYVADSADNTIRQIVIATGAVTTLAGTAGAGAPGYADGISSAASFNVLQGITSDGTNLYLADSGNSTIRKIVIATGAVTTLAGKAGFSGYGDGIGSAASFYNPQGITTDGTNLYVTDASNSTIRQIVIATGAVTTLAGSAGVIGSSDGTGLAARFYYPQGITTDGKNLYVADSLNNTIRKVVIATGAVTTLTGIAGFSGYADGTGLAATLSYPTDVTTDGTNLYVADSGNNTIRKIVIATGAVTTLAGSVLSSGSVDGISSAASFKMPQGITTDGTNLYVADSESGTIRKIVIATGAVITLAGKTGVTGHANGTGATASFSMPVGMTTDGTSLYTVDSGNNTIRKIQ